MDKAIVIHSDILGFKEIIKKSENDKNDETLNTLKVALGESEGILKMLAPLGQKTKTRLRSKLFSDNLYASFYYDEDDILSFSDAFITAIIFSRMYFANMLNNKIAVRGGVSFGNDYCDETMIFSMALVKAYELETEKAIYPRIIIDNELVNLVKAGLEVPSQLIKEILNNSILKDSNDVYFVNPSGLAKDFNSEHAGFKGDALDKIYIKQNIIFAQEEIKKQDSSTEQGKRIIKKYESLLDLLFWNLNDRNQEAKLDSFKALNFN
jgi:hypothetical protein